MLEMKVDDWVEIGDGAFVQLALIRKNKVKLRFDAPKNILIKRIIREKK